MKLNKSERMIILTIWFIILFTLPILTDIYYATFYYAGVFLLIPITFYRIICAINLIKNLSVMAPSQGTRILD